MISAEDGMLARDINKDKEINNGAELFGNFTKLKKWRASKEWSAGWRDNPK